MASLWSEHQFTGQQLLVNIHQITITFRALARYSSKPHQKSQDPRYVVLFQDIKYIFGHATKIKATHLERLKYKTTLLIPSQLFA